MTKDKQKPVAFVTGVTGQDGAHLAASLLRDGYSVYGGFRRGSSNKTWRTDHLGITNDINLIEFQLNEPQNLIEILQMIQPDEIYNLAGESFVADSFKYPGVALDANTHGTVNILEAVRLMSPESRLFFASSSEVFGRNPDDSQLNEDSRFRPGNPYAISKLAADCFVRLYREKYGLYACSGILFNHEGPLRGRQFVTRKITYNIARLKLVGGDPIELGDLNAARDWGSAIDYVEAMRLMLNIDQPQDFVISTGRLSTVRDWLGLAASAAGFDPVFEGQGATEVCVDKVSGKKIAIVAERYFRPYDTAALAGDPAKITQATAWEQTRNLHQIVEEMVIEDSSRRERGQTDV
jgi:GDPmannose 4,6-dehydratase